MKDDIFLHDIPHLSPPFGGLVTFMKYCPSGILNYFIEKIKRTVKYQRQRSKLRVNKVVFAINIVSFYSNAQ
jgi:hypothetical protein